MSGDLTATFPCDEAGPQFAKERKRDGDDKPARHERAAPRELKVDPGPLVRGLALGDPKAFPGGIDAARARGSLIELCYFIADRSRALRKKFDPETRAIALEQALVYLFEHGGLSKFNEQRASFRTWVTRILESRAKDRLRTLRVKTLPYSTARENADGEEREDSPALRPQGHDANGRPLIPGAEIAEPLRQLENREAIAIAISALTEREAEIVLASAEGFAPAEIAERIGLSAGRVRSLLSAARRKAKAALATAV